MAAAEKQLGVDPRLAPGGIAAKGRMEDESIGGRQTTNYTLSLTNNSVVAVPNVQVEVARIAGGNITVNPTGPLTILSLEPNETENVVFQVVNNTNAAVTNYTLRNRIQYLGLAVHQFDNFIRP